MELLEQYVTLHKGGAFKAWAGGLFLPQILQAVHDFDAVTLLDYGCGNADPERYHRTDLPHWCHVTMHDPAVERFAEVPHGIFDGVICTDVAEHVPELEVAEFCRTLCDYAGKFLFMTACQRPAKKNLPNGMNAHVTLKPMGWWKKQVEPHLRKGTELILMESP